MIDDFKPKKPTPKQTPSSSTPGSVIFQPPEVVADQELPADQIPTIGTPPEQKSFNHKPSRWARLKSWRPTRKQLIIMVPCLLLLIGGVGFALTRPDAQPVANTKKTAQPLAQPQEPIVAKLTGLPIADANINKRPVTAVVIENSLDARPQSGLDQMGVVFEAVAEGGITRFVSMYQDTQPEYIGPVRSLRPYYLHWSMGFDAPVAHVGGSPEALAEIRGGGKDLDQFYNSGAYQRVSNRRAPHNVYTSAAKLNTIEATKGFDTSTYDSFPRKADSKSSTPNANTVDINISSSSYASHYDYDPGTNAYKRSQGGSAHMQVDASGKETQITPKVVVALVMQQGIHSDGKHTTYNDVGSGAVYIFQDGVMTQGTWKKADLKSQITFTDANNKPIKLNAGQTWITAVSGVDRITHK